MTDPAEDTRPVGFSVTPRITVYGPVCACGYVPTAAMRTVRRARWKCKLKVWLHRLRHPFRERRSITEELEVERNAPDLYASITLGSGGDYDLPPPECPECGEVVAWTASECGACGHEFLEVGDDG